MTTSAERSGTKLQDREHVVRSATGTLSGMLRIQIPLGAESVALTRLCDLSQRPMTSLLWAAVHYAMERATADLGAMTNPQLAGYYASPGQTEFRVALRLTDQWRQTLDELTALTFRPQVAQTVKPARLVAAAARQWVGELGEKAILRTLGAIPPLSGGDV